MTSTSTTSNITIDCSNTTAASNYSWATTTAIPYDTWNLNTTVTTPNWVTTIGGKTIEEIVDEVIQKNAKQEGKKEKQNTMANKFKFGPITDDSVRLSIRGVAVKNTVGDWVCYDEKADELIEVNDFTFTKCGNVIYAMPVALKEVACSDLIIHNGHYCYVLDGDETVLNVLDISDGSIKDIMPTKSPFGFSFVTKVTSLIDPGKASADSPFGENFLPYLMMMNGDVNNKALLLMMMQKGGSIDPMMMLLMNN